MKTKFLIIVMLIAYTDSFAQHFVRASADELYKYLKKQDNLFETFSHHNRYNIEKKKFVSDTIRDFNDVKNAYYNDSLKNLLINLYLDSVGWANYHCDQYLYTEKNDYKEDSALWIKTRIKPYLKGLKFKNVDSIISSPSLYAYYLDSFWRNYRLKNFEYDIQNVYRTIIPNELIDLIGKIKYTEVYNHFYYEWQKECMGGLGTFSTYYHALESCQCPEIVSPKINTDSTISQEVAYYAAMAGTSDAYKLMMDLIDNTEFVFDGVNNDVPINMFLLGSANNNWTKRYCDVYKMKLEMLEIFSEDGEVSEMELNDLENIGKQFYSDYEEEFGKIVWSVSIYLNHDLGLHYSISEHQYVDVFDKDELVALSKKNILPNVEYLRSFIKKRYDSALKDELYWKQNMPYYKKE